MMATACNSASQRQDAVGIQDLPKGSYGYDLHFLKENEIELLELVADDSSGRVMLIPGWQGRVMTSSARGLSGKSYGWINHKLIGSGQVNNQFNPFGGEERFWLGPEGGPFSIYFQQGAEQNFENWKVPDFIDTHPFKILSQNQNQVTFSGKARLPNAAGNILDVSVLRKVKLLSKSEISANLELKTLDELEYVAYQSENTLTNDGSTAWTKDHGFLSIWMLCMFSPSSDGIVIVPVNDENKNIDDILTDDYFGKVPDDRLKLIDGVVYFKVDGIMRSKIGISPSSALSIAAGYDMANQELTLVSYSGPDRSAPYVNSVWGDQKDPLKGDVINSYNDGPVDGQTMGPFYEIETSSRAALLSPDEQLTHIQSVYHFKGSESSLDQIVRTSLGVTLHEVKKVFNNPN